MKFDSDKQIIVEFDFSDFVTREFFLNLIWSIPYGQLHIFP